MNKPKHTPTPRPDLDAIRARCEAATPGPWCIAGENNSRGGGMLICTKADWKDSAGCDTYLSMLEDQVDGVATDADSRFIAHARTDVPALLDEVERLRAVLEDLRRELASGRMMKLTDEERRYDMGVLAERARAALAKAEGGKV